MYVFDKKKKKNCKANVGKSLFFQKKIITCSRYHCFEVRKLFKNLTFFRKTACTHTFTFQPCYSTTPKWRLHIYFNLKWIWAELEKCAIALKQIDCPFLSEITGLLPDSRWTWPREGRDQNQSFVCLAEGWNARSCGL